MPAKSCKKATAALQERAGLTGPCASFGLKQGQEDSHAM